MSADSAVTYTSVHSEARSWSIPSEDPYEEVARQLLEQAPRSPEYVPDPIELEDHVPVYIPEPEHPEDLVPAEDEAPTPPLPPFFLSPRIRPPRTRAAMAQMRATAPSTYHPLLPSGTPPLLPIPLPAPSTSRRADIPKADTPPRKRLLLTTPRPSCEVGESSAAALYFFICKKEMDSDVMLIELIKDDEYLSGDELNKDDDVGEEFEGNHFDKFPTYSELAYYKYTCTLKGPTLDLDSLFRHHEVKGMHIFVGNFANVLDFIIIEDISLVIDLRVSHVVLGKPFVELSGMTYDSSLGVEDEAKKNGVELSWKILGFYKECLEFRPEYRTGQDKGSSGTSENQGGVTLYLIRRSPGVLRSFMRTILG
ncbi:hypothetical protein Tco_0874148 [Tanacetum coccineum]|uniref:Uncharacterized protein n=1 Tax=Tanacetum coccineum TaxID=301880 RepID=A0ABQ5BNM3_9ASTR